MKTFYKCEICGKLFDSASEAAECEKAHKKEAERKKKLEAEKSDRTEHIQELLQSYVNDYKELPSIKIKGLRYKHDFDDLIDLFFKF